MGTSQLKSYLNDPTNKTNKTRNGVDILFLTL